MIASFYSLNRVTGAEYWVAGYFVCMFMYLAICLLFRHCRTKSGLRAVLLNLLLSEILCDVVWFSMYFPDGEYYNHGISAVYGLFLWPAILIVSGIIIVTFNAPRMKGDGILRMKLAILALVLLAAVVSTLLLRSPAPVENNGLSDMEPEERIANAQRNIHEFNRDDADYDVRISFSGPLNGESIISLFAGKDVRLIQLSHAIMTPSGAVYQGSFLDCKGKDIQSILQQYNTEIQDSFDRESAYTMQWLGELAESAHQPVDINDFKKLEDLKAKAAYKGYRLDLIEAAAHVQSNGVPIVGARLVASGSTIRMLLADPRVLIIENISSIEIK